MVKSYQKKFKLFANCKYNRNVCLWILSFVLASCSFQHSSAHSSVEPIQKKQRPRALENGNFFEKNGYKMLYGGLDSTQHFYIDNLELKPEQFHYGIGREAFPALLKPEFITVPVADGFWSNEDRFLVAYAGNEVKAYAIKDLIRHEIVNDELNGQPIMAAYCILADLGAIYERNYGTEVLTFALSGYTYYDSTIWKGVDAFVLWDRETESLWWPLVGKAVSGELKDVKLLEMDQSHWRDTNWKTVKIEFPQAKVLKSNQDFERPKVWKKTVDINSIASKFK